MCGIAVVVAQGVVPTDLVKSIFKLIAPRGLDACGAAFFGPQGWRYQKYPGPVLVPRTLGGLLRMADRQRPRAALLHVRAATHGSPTNHHNNHPVMGDHSMLVHNGIASLPAGRAYKSYGETDSEQLLRHIEQLGVERALSTTMGSYALGMVDLSQPQVVQVVKNHWSPVYWVQLEDMLVYTSCPFTMDGLRSELMPDGELHSIDFSDGWQAPVLVRDKVMSCRMCEAPAPYVSKYAPYRWTPYDRGADTDTEQEQEQRGIETYPSRYRRQSSLWDAP